MKLRPLDAREQKFVLLFIQTGNATKAATDAGYGKAGAKVQGHRLLTRANVQAALKAHAVKREVVVLATAQERDALLTAIARDPKERSQDRIDAVKELNKVDGRHITKVEGQIDLTFQAMTDRVRKMTDAELAAEIDRTMRVLQGERDELAGKLAALPAKAEPAKG